MRLKLREWMAFREVEPSHVAAGLGVDPTVVKAWLAGDAPAFPDPETIEALCAFFACTPGDLLALERDRTATGLGWQAFRDPADEVEEVMLFPELERPAIAPAPAEREPPRSSHELLGTFGDMPLAALREWLTAQLKQVDGQLNNYKPKPGLSPAQLAQAREVNVGRKATRDAYTKALGKLDHFVRQD